MVSKVSVFSANPVGFIIMVLLLVGVGGYYAWGAIDTAGLAVEERSAVVTGKQVNPATQTYRTNIVAGRAWTQSHTQGETRVVTLKVGDEDSVGYVDAWQYQQLKAGDTVRVRVHRTRITRRLEVLEVKTAG
jgi:hypothetical protein